MLVRVTPPSPVRVAVYTRVYVVHTMFLYVRSYYIMSMTNDLFHLGQRSNWTAGCQAAQPSTP